MIQRQRGGHPCYRRNQKRRDEREALLPDQETYEGQGEFSGEGQIQGAPECDDHEHARVSEGANDIYGPSADLSEKGTHHVLSTNLLHGSSLLLPNDPHSG